jgi:hypothetical protein
MPSEVPTMKRGDRSRRHLLRRPVSFYNQNAGRTLTAAACAGWFRTGEIWPGDFELAFEVRRHDQRAGLVLGLLGRDDLKRAPEVVVTLQLLGSRAASRPSKQLALAVSPVAISGAMKPDGEWQSFVITRSRLGVHGLLNGTEILASEPDPFVRRLDWVSGARWQR